MKTPILKLVILAAIVGMVYISCNNSPKAKEENLKEAKDEVVDAKADLAKTTLDSINDFNKYKESMEKKLTEKAKNYIAEQGYSPVYGARPLKRSLQKLILDPLAMEILAGNFVEGDRIVAGLSKKGEITLTKKSRE